MENYFIELYGINVSDKIEKKNGLNYLSWAYAWAELKKKFQDAQYKVYERDDGRIYWDDGRTAWVKCSITINNIEHIEYLPVMDYNNRSIHVEKITSFDVNKAIQRCLTKACARHGLGLYIYSGEDLPEELDEAKEVKDTKEVKEVEEYASAKEINALIAYAEANKVNKEEIKWLINKKASTKGILKKDLNEIKDFIKNYATSFATEFRINSFKQKLNEMGVSDETIADAIRRLFDREALFEITNSDLEKLYKEIMK